MPSRVFRRGGWTKVRPLCFSGTLAGRLFVAAHSIVVEHVDTSLPDVSGRGRPRLHNAERSHQHAAHSAVRRHHRVAFNTLVPRAHANLELRVAFAARQYEAPFVAFALS